MNFTIARATPDDIDAVVPLYDAYRSFYHQPPDPGLARSFLSERLRREESVVFLARLADGCAAGFTQLFPMFSSVRARRVWVLNDLYVDAAARRCGIAEALLAAARDFALDDGAIRLELETMPDNHAAQALYRAQGWRQYDQTLRFHLPLAEC